MDKNEGKYNIKAISTLLGIQPGTLRAWERRYQMIAPVRNESGHRLYTEAHLEILRWLITKINQGFTISQAISLMENSGTVHSSLEKENNDIVEGLRNKLLTSLLNFDSVGSHELIDHAFGMFSIEKTIIELLGPVLIRVGDLWEEGSITTAHEHFASSFLRARIEGVSNSFPSSPFLPKAVAVCGPGERHELGLLIFSIYLRRKGFEVVFLGTSVAENDLEMVLDEVQPKFLFLSSTINENVQSTLLLAEKISHQFPDLSIGLGGTAIDSLLLEDKQTYKEFIVGQSRKEWDEWLKKRIVKTK